MKNIPLDDEDLPPIPDETEDADDDLDLEDDEDSKW